MQDKNLGLGISHIYPRFHNTHVQWNEGHTWKRPISSNLGYKYWRQLFQSITNFLEHFNLIHGIVSDGIVRGGCNYIDASAGCANDELIKQRRWAGTRTQFRYRAQLPLASAILVNILKITWKDNFLLWQCVFSHGPLGAWCTGPCLARSSDTHTPPCVLPPHCFNTQIDWANFYPNSNLSGGS